MQKQIDKKVWQQKQKVALGLNIATIVFVCLGLIFIFAKLYPDGVFSQYGIINLKFYSMIINIIALVMSIVMVVYLEKYKHGKITEIPRIIYILDFVVCSGLVFNMAMDLVYLLPVCCILKTYGVEWLFTGTNMVYYIIVPLLFGCQFMFALPNTNIKFKETFYGLIPVGAYFSIYTIIGLCNIMPNGTINPVYDFYGFGHYGAGFIALALIVLLCLSFGCSTLSWFLNRKAQGVFTKIIINLSLNVIILFMCVVAIIWLFYYPIVDPDVNGSVGKSIARRFLYFTNWSLFLMTAATCVSVAFNVWQFTGKKKEIPNWVHCLKLSAVGLVTVVLFFELFVSAPVIFIQEGINRAWRKCFGHHLMFSHLLIPLVSIFTYILPEHNKLKKKWIWVAALPLLVYSIIYMIIVYAHINVPYQPNIWWDVYGVTKYLPYTVIWLAPAIMYGLSVFFTWLIWLINNKIDKSLSRQTKIVVQKK